MTADDVEDLLYNVRKLSNLYDITRMIINETKPEYASVYTNVSIQDLKLNNKVSKGLEKKFSINIRRKLRQKNRDIGDRMKLKKSWKH